MCLMKNLWYLTQVIATLNQLGLALDLDES